MRQLLLVFLLASGVAKGQQELYPDTFAHAKGVRGIRMYFQDTLKYAYTLDQDGKVLTRRDYDKDKVAGKVVYTYENGKIVSMKSYQEREYTYGDDMNNTTFSPKDFRWDSTKLSAETVFTQGASGVTSCKYYSYPGHELLTDIEYTYGPDGRLKREDIKTYPKYGSVNFDKTQANRRKEYAYEPNLTTIYYYVDDKRAGTENIVTTTDGRIETRVIKNNKGKITGRMDYQYNTRGRLMELLINDTGEDGFGKGHPILFDHEVYSYDENGRMVARVSSLHGRLVAELAFRYE